MYTSSKKRSVTNKVDKSRPDKYLGGKDGEKRTPLT